MEQSRTYHNNPIFRASAVLLCLVLVSTWYLAGLFAKYSTSASENDKAATATFVFDIQDKEGNFVIPVTGVEKPGDQSVYKFVVTNREHGVVSEVKEKYTITMKLNGSMPVTCELSKDGSLQSLSANGELQVNDQSTGVFSASVASEDEYTLTVKWPGSINDAKYANGNAVAEVQLLIKAEQMD